MRRALVVIFLLFLLLSQVSARELRLVPSVFLTYGDYSNGRTSLDGAAYATLAVNQRSFFALALNDLKISHSDWTYRQQMGVLGGSAAWKQWRGSVAAGLIAGRYRHRVFDFNYRDHSQVFSGEIMRQQKTLLYGAEYVYFSQDGTPDIHAHQATLRGGCAFSTDLFLSARPSYVAASDGRKLYSMSGTLNAQVHSRLRLTLGAMMGERAFYFDNDLYTLYNQPETQRSVFLMRVDWEVKPLWWAVLEGIHTEFRDYSIDYWVAGLKTRLPL